MIGIDLGTTFSGLAVLNSIGKPEIVPNAQGERITPSALFFEESGNVLVGTEAINMRRWNAANSVRWVKRHMADEYYPNEIAGRRWTPAELSSFVLKKLKQDCSQQIGEITDAVVTVPAYFDEVCRKATMDAAEMAGLNVVAIINEPTAAALYYAATHNVVGRIMVFDLGGGTFDVTILDLDGTNIDIVCSRGHHQLGGYDFDQRLLERFVRTYEKEKGGPLYGTPEEKTEWEYSAETTKKTLSTRPQASEMLRGPSGSMSVSLAKTDFEEDITAHMASIEMLVETALEEANAKPEDIGQVLLVGGSTRIPLVQERLAKMFGRAPTLDVNVDECVALGAALHAGLKQLEKDPASVPPAIAASLSKISLTDVCNHHYGTICLGLVDERTGQPGLVNDILIQKNTPLPAEEKRLYRTVAAGQTSIKATVTQTQDEERDPDFVNKLFEGVLDGLPADRPAGRPVEVTYSYDTNQRMKCVFRDIESGRELVKDLDIVDREAKKEKRSAVADFQVQ